MRTSLYGVMLLVAALSATAGELRPVIVELENLAQPSRKHQQPVQPGQIPPSHIFNEAPSVFPFFYAFHDGSLRMFEMGEPASEALADLAKDGFLAKLFEAHGDTPGVVARAITNNPVGMSPFPELFAQSVARRQMLDPRVHRYFSYVGKVVPSDDAFVGTDDPMRIEVFDEDGRFRGPIVIDVYGSEVLDAGVRANEESEVWWIHYPAANRLRGTPEQDVIRRHPGYLGSLANTDSEPSILVAESVNPEFPAWCNEAWPTWDPWNAAWCYRMDPAKADFSQPGYRFLRIRITSGIDGSYAGHWYSPAHDGEGLSVEIADTDPPTMVVAWYTYRADGSGEPFWLIGSGPVDYNNATIEMYRAEGGRFASTLNPELVQRERWGEINLGFGRCHEGRIFYTPDDPAVPAGNYFIDRLTLPPRGLRGVCSIMSLSASHPDNFWPQDCDSSQPDACEPCDAYPQGCLPDG
jgi:hypothetical protein